MSRILQDIAGMRAIVIATAIFIGVGIGVGIGFFSFAPDPCEDYTMFHEKSLDYFSQKQTSGTAPDAKISDHINLVICLSYSNSSFLEAEVLLKSILHKLPPPADHLVGGIRIHLMLDTTAYSSFQSLFSDNNFNKSVWVVPVTIRLWHVSQKASNTMRLIVDKNIVEYSTFHSVAQWYRLFVPWVVQGIGDEEYLYLDTDVWLVDNIAVLWGSRNEQVMFQWGDQRCSGVMIFNAGAMRRRLWSSIKTAICQQTNSVSRIKATIPAFDDHSVADFFSNISELVRNNRVPTAYNLTAEDMDWFVFNGDQSILRRVCSTQPALCSTLPAPLGSTSLADGAWIPGLLPSLPGISLLHNNGQGSSEENPYWKTQRYTNPEVPANGHVWRGVFVYVDMTWQSLLWGGQALAHVAYGGRLAHDGGAGVEYSAGHPIRAGYPMEIHTHDVHETILKQLQRITDRIESDSCAMHLPT